MGWLKNGASRTGLSTGADIGHCIHIKIDCITGTTFVGHNKGDLMLVTINRFSLPNCFYNLSFFAQGGFKLVPGH